MKLSRSAAVEKLRATADLLESAIGNAKKPKQVAPVKVSAAAKPMKWEEHTKPGSPDKILTCDTVVTYDNGFGDQIKKAVTLRIDPRDPTNVRVDRASMGTWEAIDGGNGAKSIPDAKKIAQKWVEAVAAQNTLTPKVSAAVVSASEEMTNLWSARWSTGMGWYWKDERNSTMENAQTWLARFQKDEPDVLFVLSPKKPSAKGLPKDGPKVDVRASTKISATLPSPVAEDGGAAYNKLYKEYKDAMQAAQKTQDEAAFNEAKKKLTELHTHGEKEQEAFFKKADEDFKAMKEKDKTDREAKAKAQKSAKAAFTKLAKAADAANGAVRVNKGEDPALWEKAVAANKAAAAKAKEAGLGDRAADYLALAIAFKDKRTSSSREDNNKATDIVNSGEAISAGSYYLGAKLFYYKNAGSSYAIEWPEENAHDARRFFLEANIRIDPSKIKKGVTPAGTPVLRAMITTPAFLKLKDKKLVSDERFFDEGKVSAYT